MMVRNPHYHFPSSRHDDITPLKLKMGKIVDSNGKYAYYFNGAFLEKKTFEANSPHKWVFITLLRILAHYASRVFYRILTCKFLKRARI